MKLIDMIYGIFAFCVIPMIISRIRVEHAEYKALQRKHRPICEKCKAPVKFIVLDHQSNTMSETFTPEVSKGIVSFLKEHPAAKRAITG